MTRRRHVSVAAGVVTLAAAFGAVLLHGSPGRQSDSLRSVGLPSASSPAAAPSSTAPASATAMPSAVAPPAVASGAPSSSPATYPVTLTLGTGARSVRAGDT